MKTQTDKTEVRDTTGNILRPGMYGYEERLRSASVASDSPNITTRQATVFEIKTGLIGAGFFAKCGSVYTGGWSTERKAFNAARAQLRKRNPDATFKQVLN